MDRLQLKRTLLSQSGKVSPQKNDNEMKAIIADTVLAIKEYKRQRRREFWRGVWQHANQPENRLFI
jgi:hypothetical protein